jgi:hypothetical protein
VRRADEYRIDPKSQSNILTEAAHGLWLPYHRLPKLLPSFRRQCFYNGEILQQMLRQTVPLL